MTDGSARPCPTAAGAHDWHSAFIVYQLRLKGLSLRKLSLQHGYKEGGLTNVSHIPWVKAERIISDALGVTPQVIWPSRFNPDGTRRAGISGYDKALYRARKAAGKIAPVPREKRIEYARRTRARLMSDPQRRAAYLEKRRAEYSKKRAALLAKYHADPSKVRAYYQANRERIRAYARSRKAARASRDNAQQQ